MYSKSCLSGWELPVRMWRVASQEVRCKIKPYTDLLKTLSKFDQLFQQITSSESGKTCATGWSCAGARGGSD